nr:hypothetical protein [Tanacetum cinerariifolium]
MGKVGRGRERWWVVASCSRSRGSGADISTTLTRRVEHLEQDKVAQALEITKLKQMVKKLERRNKASKLKRLKKVSKSQRIDTSDDTVMDDISKQGRMIADIDEDVDVILKDAKEVAVEKSANVLSMQDDDVELAEIQEVVKVVTTAKLITEVVIAASATLTVAAPQLTTAAAPTLTTAPSAARRRKGVILVEEPKPLKKQAQIEQDKAYARKLEAELNKNINWDEVIDHVQRKQKEDNAVKRYQALKRKPQTEVQAKKNMMIYLRNVAGLKMDYFKGMTYDDIRPIFEKKFNSNVAFLMKIKEQMDEEYSRALKRLTESQDDKTTKKHKLDEEVKELKRHIQIVPNDEGDVYTEATPLALKVLVVDYEIYTENNKPYIKIKRADGQELEAKELEAVRVLWCADHYIYYNTVDFVVESRYPLTRFTLDQMLNNVRLEVEEESEVSLELPRIQENMLSDYCCQVKLMVLINAAKSD